MRKEKTRAAISRVEERQEDLLDYYLAEHLTGSVSPSFYEEILVERGLTR